MKQPGRWVVWLTTLLITASLVALPREGAVAGPFVDGMPPIIDEGEPDGPPNTIASVPKEPQRLVLSVTFVQGRLLVFLVPAGVAHVSRVTPVSSPRSQRTR
jgi:hypothetical protein